MAQKTTADGGTTRHETNLRLDDVSEGDRIDPALIPRSPEIGVGESVARHRSRYLRADNDDDRTFSVRLVFRDEDRRWGDVQTALIYDPESDLFARLGGHTSSGAMNQTERDWKVRDVGQDVEVVAVEDVEIPDLEKFNETAEEFVTTWVDALIDNFRHGDDYDEVEEMEANRLRLRDYDNRMAWVHLSLE